MPQSSQTEENFAVDERIARLSDTLDWAMRCAIVDLAIEPSSGHDPDASRFGPGTAHYLTFLGVLDSAGFVTEFGLRAGWAFHDADHDAQELERPLVEIQTVEGSLYSSPSRASDAVPRRVAASAT